MCLLAETTEILIYYVGDSYSASVCVCVCAFWEGGVGWLVHLLCHSSYTQVFRRAHILCYHIHTLTCMKLRIAHTIPQSSTHTV